jgi:hypothetical protein
MEESTEAGHELVVEVMEKSRHIVRVRVKKPKYFSGTCLEESTEGQTASDLTDDPSMQSALVLYSTLKAHKFMNELVVRRFERHPVMTPTFNGFLFSERASHGDIKRLEIKLAENNALTHTLQSKVDKKS